MIRINNSSRGTSGYFLRSSRDICIKLSKKNYPYPQRSNRDPVIRRPRRKITFYYQMFNDKKQIWQWWRYWKIYESIKDTPKVFSSGGYISSLELSREESLVHILAHEMRHYWQMNHPGKRGKVWGARGKFSERDADAYAIRKQREWRAIYNPQDAMQIWKFSWELIEKDVVTVKDALGVSIPINPPISSATNKDVLSSYRCGTDYTFHTDGFSPKSLVSRISN